MQNKHKGDIHPVRLNISSKTARFLSIWLLLAFLAGIVSYFPNIPVYAQSEDENQIFLPGIQNNQGRAPRGSCGTPGGDWPTVAANPSRSSWTDEQVCGNLDVLWYRPIEAYISQNTQIIAAEGLLYISTAKGLYALNPDNGALAWRFDTDMPLGNSPTVSNGVVYVGGHDRKLYALSARTGQLLWSFNQALSGYDTNPLVIDGKVILGNRDGAMYAIGAHGASRQGELIWKFQTGGPIHLSAAYKNGMVYFAANDNYAYALRADTGSLSWKSAKLPGDGYHSYWPVVYQDKVIFSAAPSYRMGLAPGTRSLTDPDTDAGYGEVRSMEADGVLPGSNQGEGQIIGPILPAQAWSNGHDILDASNVTEYLENRPSSDSSASKFKPWRRTFIVLNQSDGREYTFDSDGDGYQEYMPFAYWGSNSGNRYPPIIGADGLIYANTLWRKLGDAQGQVMGWAFGTQYLSVTGGQAAVAEPQALSGSGTMIYRSLCCDRVGGGFDIRDDGERNVTLWSYNLAEEAPGYDEMWTILPGWPRLWGWYTGASNSASGAYHNHGDQNPFIPYRGKLFIHRSNAIIAYGTDGNLGKQPLLTIQPAAQNTNVLSSSTVRSTLEAEVQKILSAGLLRPGYYNSGQFGITRELVNYFENPGETLYTLAIAYPHLSTSLKSQVIAYLQNYFDAYFDSEMYANIGWGGGAAREAMPIPPDLIPSMQSEPNIRAGAWSWFYPPHNMYSLWKYAQLVPSDALTAYNLAKSKIQVPLPSQANTEYLLLRPYEHNAYMAGYIGFLNLQDLVGMSQQDSQLRSQVTAELNRLLSLRWQTFTKNSPYSTEESFTYRKQLDIARNFIYLVPELGDYYRQNILGRIDEAVAEYEYIAPYWFVTRYEAVIGEGAMSNLYNSWALFLAKALIQKAPYSELAQYIDAPAFERGDLYFIQKLVLALQADGAATFTGEEVAAYKYDQ